MAYTLTASGAVDLLSERGRRMRRRKGFTAVPVSCAILVMASCGNDVSEGTAERPRTFEAPKEEIEQASKRQTFVGKVEGTNAYIAIDLIPSAAVRTYVCDSAQIRQWFDGQLSEDVLQATASSSPEHLRATRVGNAFAGTVELAGVVRPFRAEPAEYPAGLYLGGTTPYTDIRGAWVVLSDGSQRGSATKSGVPLKTSVSPDSGGATAGDETVDVGAGGGTGAPPVPRKKKKQTKAERCTALQSSYQWAISTRDTYPEGSADYKFHDGIAAGILQSAVNAGCFDF